MEDIILKAREIYKNRQLFNELYYLRNKAINDAKDDKLDSMYYAWLYDAAFNMALEKTRKDNKSNTITVEIDGCVITYSNVPYDIADAMATLLANSFNQIDITKKGK